MTTTPHNTDLMTEVQLDAVPGGCIVIITANRPPYIGDGTSRAKPHAYGPTPPKPGVFLARHRIGAPSDPL